MIIEIRCRLPDDVLVDAEHDIENEINDAMDWLRDRGLVEEYEIEVKSL